MERSSILSRNSSALPESGRAAKRLQSELASLMLECVPGVSAFPEADDILTWRGTISSSENSLFSGMRFHLTLKFPLDYPFSPPVVTFTTRCFHPNVDYGSGAICLDILKEHWSSTYTVKTILLSIQSLLDEPNVESPLNVQAASLWEADPAQFRAVCVTKYEEATGEKIMIGESLITSEGKAALAAHSSTSHLQRTTVTLENSRHRTLGRSSSPSFL
ncbi:ubiquitin-conjugating enzyme [Cyanidiococcus yangmingshanensis]|uniref:Ubiquitin-conjugating enzyme n=1 Tax=Cyanidiococcus yangmingshanensis TaxID=2690220 RepID=A0A7J7IM98_9RHOD|nr:ubiquitin-conjugating enzyme [Cyanidiococcus yangmingshanensis]